MSASNELPRLVILHKQGTSARVRFMALGDSVLAFSPLPEAAALRGEDYISRLSFHPTAALRAAEQKLGLAEGGLEPVPDFCLWLDTPQGDLAVLLAACTGIDPPFEAVEKQGGKFIAIIEARRLPQIEREILRRAYEHVLG
ncbi:MAG: hypothetical protein ACM3X0_11285 [Bacteroidota bacterium]